MQASIHAVDAASRAVAFRTPGLEDGKHLWRMAKRSRVLDLNSPYAYLLFGGPFCETSIVAEVGGELVGFVMGFRPPDHPDALFVWQVAVDTAQRGKGLARRMMEELIERLEANAIRATVTPSNAASMRLFRSLAEHAGCECQETPYLLPEHFPEPGHEAEVLFHIGPLRRTS